MPRKTKKPKDPNAPKKPLTSYFSYSNERREILKKEMPEKKLTELSKVIAAEWKKMDEDTKKGYTERASKAKEKYERKRKVYEQTDEFKQFQKKLEQWKEQQKDLDIADRDSSGASIPKVSLPRKPKDPNCPKRPASSYFLFGNSVRADIKAENPTLKVTEIAKLIGKRWGNLSENDKKPFAEEALKLKKQYLKKVEKYKGSAEEAAYKEKLEDWEGECAQRRSKAAALAQRRREKEEGTSTKGKNKKGGRKTKKRREPESESESESESSSEGSSMSDDSDMSSGSDSGSDSEESSS